MWRKSTYSATGGNQSVCIKLANLARHLGIRDSKDSHRPHPLPAPATAADLAFAINLGEPDLI
ncbi:DUF397 domain-containing protein [Actinomadura rupiterrae]|uniref:DUF397 domain-containing protein n=1 Tax=Actinomadura rupiterrae TaxID=559627 RepID=UPI0020A48593|nr:DUF397 domain-containing protein [Actinomadura rupiterrae]